MLNWLFAFSNDFSYRRFLDCFWLKFDSNTVSWLFVSSLGLFSRFWRIFSDIIYAPGYFIHKTKIRHRILFCRYYTSFGRHNCLGFFGIFHWENRFKYDVHCAICIFQVPFQRFLEGFRVASRPPHPHRQGETRSRRVRANP